MHLTLPFHRRVRYGRAGSGCHAPGDSDQGPEQTHVMLLLMALAVAAAGVVEVLNYMAGDLFVSGKREGKAKEAIEKVRKDISEAEEKVKAARATLRSALGEVDKAKTDLIQLERDAAQKRRVPSVLVYRIGEPEPTQTRFRAPISKALAGNAEPHEKALWSTQSFVEAWADTPAHARGQAERQFRRERGYALGAFEPHGSPT
jgi:cellobiose-specific phosphotransferase system component IIA